MDALARRARLATALGTRDVARMAKHARRAGTTDADRRRDLARRCPRRARSTTRAHHACGSAALRACTCLRRVEDVGPGYDAVWVTGFTDSAWPQPPHGNPLLPIALQREHGMPYSSPRDAEERSRRAVRPARPAEPRARRELAGARVRLRNGAEPRHSIMADAVRRRARRNDHRSAVAHRRARNGCRRRSSRSPAAACQAGREPSGGRHAAPCGRSVRTDSARGSSSHSDLACRPACGVSQHTEPPSDC